MDKVVFAAGVRPLVTDLNAIHTLTEGAFGTLLQAITGSTSGKILFNNLTSSADVEDSIITVTTLQQLFSVDGVIAVVESQEQAFAIPESGTLQIGVFLVAGREGLTEERNFISTDPTTSIVFQQNLITKVRELTRGRVMYVTNTTLAQQLDAPILAPSDVGFIKLATVVYDAQIDEDGVQIIANNSDIYRLPTSAAVPVTTHASSHLPGGNDVVPPAVLSSAAVGGSSAGLMPEGALTSVLGAVQAVTASDTSSFIEVLASGDNAPASIVNTPRSVVIDLRLDASLTPQDNDGVDALAVNFLPKSAVNGESVQAARSDHVHPLTAAGIIVKQITIDVTSASLGSVSAMTLVPPVGVDVDRILSVDCHWQPPNLVSSSSTNSVPAQWFAVPFQGSIVTVGARALITGATTFKLEIGAAGITYMTPQAISEVSSWTLPAYSGGMLPSVGKLLVLITAVRAGAL